MMNAISKRSKTMIGCLFAIAILLVTTIPQTVIVNACNYLSEKSAENNEKQDTHSQDKEIAVPLIPQNDVMKENTPVDTSNVVSNEKLVESIKAKYLQKNIGNAGSLTQISPGLSKNVLVNQVEEIPKMIESGGSSTGYVDLDVDSDNDQGISFPTRNATEDAMENNPSPYPGKYIILNDDDDNKDRMIDLNDKGPTKNENELVPLVLEINVSNKHNGDIINFEFDGITTDNFRIWKNKTRGNWSSDGSGDNIVQYVQPGQEKIYQYTILRLGDVNNDSVVSFADIDPFVAAIGINETNELRLQFQAKHPTWSWRAADINQDGSVTFADIDPFVAHIGNNAPVALVLWIEGIKPSDYYTITVRADLNNNGDFDDDGPNSIDSVKITVAGSCSEGGIFGVPKGYNGNDPQFMSRGWFLESNLLYCGRSWYPGGAGFPLQISLLTGFGPGDFPPTKTDPQQSTAPLVSKETGYFGRPNPPIERPTHNDIIDMITGTPLLQETDFELPFGGAVFRHTRTYSENIVDSLKNRYGTEAIYEQDSCAGEDTFWDWNGKYWMMSENPILLIDATYKDLVTPAEAAAGIKRCYFIPDAHHAIPFTLDPNIRDENNNPVYTAPDWFDAIMTYSGGIWDDNKTEWKDWAVHPTEYYIWLNHNSIKYTFKPQYEDVWFDRDTNPNHSYPYSWIDAHVPPPDYSFIYPPPAPYSTWDSGYGVPFYGLVTNISDQHGNRMQYDYCTVHQYPSPQDTNPNDDFIECLQNTNEKGQIKDIKLIDGNGTVVWTILYSYRAFATGDRDFYPGPSWPDSPGNNEAFLVHKLHSIHVYNGNIPANVLNDFVSTIGYFGNFSDLTSFDAYDQIENPSISTVESRAGNHWVIRVNYTYEEAQPYYSYQNPWCYDGPTNWYSAADPNSQYYKYYINCTTTTPSSKDVMGCNLLKTTISKKTHDNLANEIIQTSHTIYRYDNTLGPSAHLTFYDDTHGLKAVFYDSTIQKIVEEYKQRHPGVSVNENILFTLSDNCILIPDDPSTSFDESQTLLQASDVYMTTDVRFPGNSWSDPLDSPYTDLVNFIGTDPAKTSSSAYEKTSMVDHRAGRNDGGTFYYYNFKIYPRPLYVYEPQFGNAVVDIVSRYQWLSEVHYPYRYMVQLNINLPYHPDTIGPTENTGLPFDQPFRIMVIDEVDTTSGITYDAALQTGIKTRRVVRMNPTGFVLEDETWTYNGTGAQMTSHMGYSEHRLYNDKGQLLQLRSAGWATDENLMWNGPDWKLTHGFVCNYTYYDDYFKTVMVWGKFGLEPKIIRVPGKLKSEGVQSGDGSEQPVYVQKLYDRDVNNQEYVNRTIQFPTPVLCSSDLFLANGRINISKVKELGGEITEEQITFRDNDSDKGILSQTEIKPPTPLSADNNDLYFGVDKIQNDNNGNMILHGYGSLKNISIPGTGVLDQFFVDYNQYDIYGQPILQVQDANPSNYPDFPVGWVRVPANGALDLTTRYEYDLVYGLKRVIYPTGLETWIVYNQPSSYILERWTYNNVDLNKAKVGSPVQINIYINGTLNCTKLVHLNIPGGWSSPTGDEPYEILSISVPGYDTNGRVTDVKTQGKNGETVSSKVSYHATGQVAREQTPDGTIKRYTYTMRGYLERTYQGMNDIHPFWGTACPPVFDCGYCQGNPLICTYPDTMTLIEKRYYGNKTTDAGKLITVRTYTDKPLNQYFEVDSSGNPVPAPNNEDEIGSVTNYSYDWRMRQVSTQYKNETGVPLKYEVVWLDNLGRKILEAEYGPEMNIPVQIQPWNLSPGWNLTMQNITDILSVSLNQKPLSLTQTIYNARGQTEETRRYNVSDSSGLSYLSDQTFYDNNGKTVEQRSSNGAVTKTIYDSKGRQISSSSWVNVSSGWTEITRTNMTYNSRDQVIKTVSWERKHNALVSDRVLTVSNSVKTYSYTWYDTAGKVSCSAEYGTNNAQGYITGNDPYPDCPEGNYPLDPPQVFPAGVLVTRHGYNNASVENATYQPDGTVTRTEYDGLGRQILVTENADDSNVNMRRSTAYFYDNKTGQLQKMAAVLPNHNGTDGLPGLANWSDINWSATNGSLQVTEMVYGADVVEKNNKVLTFDGKNDYVEIPNSNAMLQQCSSGFSDGSFAFMISVWFKTDDPLREQSIVNMGCDKLGSESGWRVFLKDGKVNFTAKENNDCTVFMDTPLNNPSSWHHVAIIYYAMSWSYYREALYLDGVLKNWSRWPYPRPSAPVVFLHGENVTIGRMAYVPSDGSGKFFIGQIKEVSVYNISDNSAPETQWFWQTSESDIVASLYKNGGYSSVVENATMYWKMNEGSGYQIIDSKGLRNGFVHSASWMGQYVNTNGALIKEVRYPNNVTGQPDVNDSLKFRYYFNGAVASRTDSKGVIYRYSYDELGRMVETLVDDSYYYDPNGSGVEPIFVPQQRISRINYSYTPDGSLSLVTAFNRTGTVVSQDRFEYDVGMRNLVKEQQAHGGNVTGTTPAVTYGWEFNSTTGGGNFNRLRNITYPGGRIVGFCYDGGSGLDTLLSRVSRITDSVLGITVANYTYAGLSRRVNTTFGNGMTQKIFDDSGLYTGLDRFGRVTNLNFTKDGTIIQRYQYGYDAAGNRLYSNVTQLNHVNDRSFLYQYDALNRLVNASMGKLNAMNTQIIQNQGVPSQNVSWRLDNLGNWAGGTTADGSRIQKNDTNGDGTYELTYAIHHDVNKANQITKIYTNGVPPGVQVVYDRAGNLVYDGQYFYQYDGFNRLVQVNYSGIALLASDFDGDGRINLSHGHLPASLVARYIYDGLGRLIRKETPPSLYEDYYYDGVRRLQEVRQGTQLYREYVYGPDSVDEFILQLDESHNPFYVVQDANYNVMALVDAGGSVKVQYQYDPYGTLVAMDTFSGAPINKVGHQGLFFENFSNGGIGLNTAGLYYNRNRWYSPTLGRFLQRDPNEAAQPIMTACVMNGDILQLTMHMYSLQGQYSDGMNLYNYLGSNPVNHVDPSGLWKGSGHKSLTVPAMKAKGFSSQEIEKAVSADIAVDSPTGEGFVHYAHYESGCDSKKAEDRISYFILIAAKKSLIGDEDGAMSYLGRALHTAQDKGAHWDAGVGGFLDHGVKMGKSLFTFCPDDPNDNPTGYAKSIQYTNNLLNRYANEKSNFKANNPGIQRLAAAAQKAGGIGGAILAILNYADALEETMADIDANWGNG